MKEATFHGKQGARIQQPTDIISFPVLGSTGRIWEITISSEDL